MGIKNLQSNFGQTRNQLGSEPFQDEVVAITVDNIRVEEGPTVVQTEEIAGDSFILGNSLKGVLGQNKLTTGIAFVVGNPTYGVLGSTKLTTGTGYNPAVIVEVRNRNNTFIERFNLDFFRSDDTTATWSNGSLSFTTGQVAISKSCYKGTSTVSFATLTVSNATNLTLYLSANGGTNWEAVTNNKQHFFTNTGNDLRFKIEASGAATITSLRIKYG